MIVPAYYEDLHTLHLGTMPNRAYYIPASARREDLVEHRERSDRFQLLNDDWSFQYFSSVHDLTELFYQPEYDVTAWDTIPVPSVWQNHGYDRHQYTNIRYPFPADPPYVPVDNPCGAYRYTFDYVPDAAAPRVYLNFEGVDSCFYVWLNGQWVGYSQVSHSTSEFDVTESIREGSNTLAVLVLKWCDGSYLEDQDKFRTSGIFRDVYLLKRPDNSIRDYFTTTVIGEEETLVRIRLAYQTEAVSTKIKLISQDGKCVATATAKAQDSGAYTHQAVLTVKDPVLWNPEQPYLYTLVLETPDEVITDRVGLREIHVEDNQVFVNGSPIKFRGVNRHDSDPVTGPVISVEHMKRDLQMIKEYNFNAIRTSHYPNAPMFYQLCDQYGFMVIDEADNESHGASALYCKGNDTWENHVERWNEPFADNPDFLEATMDRTQRCVQRDKNRPSVICWSMGNESAYGCCFEAALAWTKHFDPARLTHYEAAQYRSRKRKYDFSNIDLYSNMYPSLETLQAYIDSNPDKPYLMCEYAHAMGNGPGDLEDYWQFIQANDIMSGGFVWEWCDHAIYAGQADNGKTMYLYGGDHGEYPHDGNFCVDGLVYPDRRPHTGLMEYKNIHRPARVTAYD
ncbi:MAG: beta-galactosidase, partial [Lachnospiraceae bacterium]|nr:beta-galactosidase [Lachnospiraceae bacterium]